MTFAIQPGLVIFKFRHVISRVTMQLSIASKIVLFLFIYLTTLLVP
jgi:hypothetical protein